MSYNVEEKGYVCPEKCCLRGRDAEFELENREWNDGGSHVARPIYQLIYIDAYDHRADNPNLYKFVEKDAELFEDAYIYERGYENEPCFWFRDVYSVDEDGDSLLQLEKVYTDETRYFL